MVMTPKYEDFLRAVRDAGSERGQDAAQLLYVACRTPLAHLFPFVVEMTVAGRLGSQPAGVQILDRRTRAVLKVPLEHCSGTIELAFKAEKSLFQSRVHKTKGYLHPLLVSTAAVLGQYADTIERNPKPSIQWALFDGLGESIVAYFLSLAFGLTFHTKMFLALLRGFTLQTYENHRVTQGYLVRNKARLRNADAPHLLELMEADDKQLLPTCDGFLSVLELRPDGRCLRLRALIPQPPKGRTFYPRWMAPLASETGTPDANVAIALTQHGDVLVLAHENLLLSSRAGTWRVYEHNDFVTVIEQCLEAVGVGAKEAARRRMAREMYRTALDVSFSHTGGLIGVLGPAAEPDEFVEKSDRVRVGRGLLRLESSRQFASLDRIERQALAGIDGAIVMDSQGTLVAFGAIVKGAPKPGARLTYGARTRAALRLSEAGVALKISSDGEISLFAHSRRFLTMA